VETLLDLLYNGVLNISCKTDKKKNLTSLPLLF